MKANPLAPRASMLSILDWENAWSKDQPFPFTPSVAEINGLDAALDLYLNEGPEAVWARHALTAKAMRAGVQAMGLSMWAARGGDRLADDDRGPDARRHRREDAAPARRARATASSVFRPRRDARQADAHRPHGTDGAADLRASSALTALGGALNALGAKLRVGKGIDAALAVIDADA